MRFESHGIVKNGHLELANKDWFLDGVKRFQGDVLITIEPDKASRTTQQNRYYFGVIVKILADELGYSVDEMHEALKWKFLKIHENELPTVRSTTDLSTAEFSDYCEKIKQFAAFELSVVLPDPGQADWLGE